MSEHPHEVVNLRFHEAEVDNDMFAKDSFQISQSWNGHVEDCGLCESAMLSGTKKRWRG